MKPREFKKQPFVREVLYLYEKLENKEISQASYDRAISRIIRKYINKEN